MEPEESPFNQLEVRTYFVRGRNALLARADFGALYEDYYLHWLQHGIKFPVLADDILKDALAALVLHLAARPQDEFVAWTVNFQQPLLNLFVTGSSRPGNVVGRVWTEGVRMGDHGLFCAESRSGSGGQRRSNVNFDAPSFFPAVEAFYAQSEQRPARFFRHGPEDIVFISAQPDCDTEWLAGLDEDAVRNIDQIETLSLLESRLYHFDCGCTAERIIQRLSVLSPDDKAGLFEDGDAIRVDCPRCGAVFEISKELFDRTLGN